MKTRLLEIGILMNWLYEKPYVIEENVIAKKRAGGVGEAVKYA